MSNKTIPIKRHKRSTPSEPSKSQNYPKKGPKTVEVEPYKRSKPSK